MELYGEALALTGRKVTRFGEKPAFEEGLYDLGNHTYAWMVPNGSWGENNCALVVGDGESLLLDTQWDLSHTAEMLEAMRPITRDAPIRYLVISHADGDHSWGCKLLGAAQVVMSAATSSEVCSTRPLAMTLMSAAAGTFSRFLPGSPRKALRYLHGMTAPYDFRGARCPVADIAFTKELAFSVGGREVRLTEAGPAHTHGDIYAYVPDAGVVLCGDIVFRGSTPVLWAGPLENWITSLDRMLGLDANVFVPGHGPLCERNDLLEVRSYWEYMTSEFRRRFDSGMSARDAAWDIALSADFASSKYAGWDSPERIVTSTHVTWGHLQGKGGRLKNADRLLVLWRQGVLAARLPGATPASMHLL